MQFKIAAELLRKAWEFWETHPDQDVDKPDEVVEKETLQEKLPLTLAASMLADAFDDLQRGSDVKNSPNPREHIARTAIHSGTTHISGVGDRTLRQWKHQVVKHKPFHQLAKTSE